MSATTDFKLYLNNIINEIDSDVHNKLSDNLVSVISEKEQLTKELELYKEAIQNIHVRCKRLAERTDNNISSKAYFMTCKDIAEHQKELVKNKIEQINKDQ